LKKYVLSLLFMGGLLRCRTTSAARYNHFYHRGVRENVDIRKSNRENNWSARDKREEEQRAKDKERQFAGEPLKSSQRKQSLFLLMGSYCTKALLQKFFRGALESSSCCLLRYETAYDIQSITVLHVQKILESRNF